MFSQTSVSHSVHRGGGILGLMFFPGGGEYPLSPRHETMRIGIHPPFYWNAFLLPTANEVWGKVIFLNVCVILSTDREVCMIAGECAWLPGGGVHGCWGVCMVAGGMRGCRLFTCIYAWLGGACVVVGRCVWLVGGA